MDLSQALKEEGWYLSNEAINRISDNGNITNVKTLQHKAIDLDLREIGVPSFPEDIVKGKLESIPGNIVVQVQKVRNVSAPKANEESRAAPRMLKIALTDGHSVCQAVELETVPSISLDTPPGTKLLLKGECLPLSHGVILLTPPLVQVIGGRVRQLVDKWELHRSLAKHTRGRVGEEGGPPPWIPFGQKIVRTNLPNHNFKSLEDGKENRENSEFEAQRKDAIAEAARGGARKIFGGGNARSLVDRNVRQIVEMGFSTEQAEHSLHLARNNVAKAIRILQKKEVNASGGTGPGGGTAGGGPGGRSGRRRGGGGGADREESGGGGSGGGNSGGANKPSGKLSLFAFLEVKLPTQNEKETGQQQENNTSSQPHEQSGRGSHTGLHSRGGGRGRAGGDSGRPPREERGQNQKPPRFQNQQRHQDNANNYSGWSSYRSGAPEFSYDQVPAPVSSIKNNYGNSRGGGGRNNSGYEDGYTEHGYGQPRRHNSNAGPPSSYSTSDHTRNIRPYNNSGQNQGHGYTRHSGGGDTYSRQLIEAGMPEIPEFPFKDTSAIPPLMSAGYYTTGGGYGNHNTSHNTHPHSANASSSPAPPSPQYAKGGNTLKGDQQVTTWQWKVGDKCMAKYWEDNIYYNAEVTGLSKKTCVVRFLEYGNFEEVLQDDCIPITEEGMERAPPVQHHHHQPPPNHNHNSIPPNAGSNRFSGILEFRRGGTRPYIKSSGIDGNSGNEDRGQHPRRNQPRSTQSVYVPPAQRKDPPPAPATYK